MSEDHQLEGRMKNIANNNGNFSFYIRYIGREKRRRNTQIAKVIRGGGTWEKITQEKKKIGKEAGG